MKVKTCPKCQTEKTVADFNLCRSRRDGLDYRCRDCKRDYRRMYAQQPEVRDRQAKSISSWRESNLDRYREIGRSWARAKRASDPLWARLRLGADRARAAGVHIEKFSSADLIEYWHSNGISPNHCYYSGAELDDTFQLDHMVPLSRGGSHSMDNIVPCVRSANSGKYNRTADEYLARIRDST